MKKVQRKLPKGWQWVRTTDVLDSTQKLPIRMGPFGSQLKKDEFVEDGIFVLGIEHVINKKFDDKGYKFITNDKFRQLKGFEVKPGDVLMTTMGTIGRTAVVPTGVRKSIISSHLLKLTLKSDVYPEYIAWVLDNNSPVYKRLAQASQGAIMQGLNTDIVKKLRFPIPLDFNEQVMICKKLENKMADVEKMRQAALQQLETIQAIPAAILREVFDFLEANV
jgi:type I restriction enzyme S subunit